MTRRAVDTHRKSADWRNFPFVETLFVRAQKSAEATMLCRGDEGSSRSALGIACLVIALSFSTPASAGFLERLFGAFRHSHHAPRAPAIMQPFADSSGDLPMEREMGPAVGYCVRSCDGQYFPVHAQPGLSAASRRWQAAHAMAAKPSASPAWMRRAIRRSGRAILSQPKPAS